MWQPVAVAKDPDEDSKVCPLCERHWREGDSRKALESLCIRACGVECCQRVAGVCERNHNGTKDFLSGDVALSTRSPTSKHFESKRCTRAGRVPALSNGASRVPKGRCTAEGMRDVKVRAGVEGTVRGAWRDANARSVLHLSVDLGAPCCDSSPQTLTRCYPFDGVLFVRVIAVPGLHTCALYHGQARFVARPVHSPAVPVRAEGGLRRESLPRLRRVTRARA